MEHSSILSFQISHMASKVRVANALRWGLAPEARRDHHSLMLRPAHCLGWIPWIPRQSFWSSQTCTMKWQWTKRWFVDSVTYFQSGQSPQFGYPLFWSLSAVHRRFWRANQVWCLALGGAHAFQTIEYIIKFTRPRNWASYVEEAKYWPFSVRFQVIASSWREYAREAIVKWLLSYSMFMINVYLSC
jgi:hypothetical protein